MSKHIGRKQKWTEISNKRFSNIYGYVELNTFGFWDAIVVFKKRKKLQEKQIERPWVKMSKHCGEHKRVRQAMMAVEENAKRMIAERNPDRLI